MKKFLSDISLSAVSAGLIAVLVGFASAMAIVFQAAQASGANEQHIVSWVWALGIGMGIGCIWLSVKYKRPIIVAWSTPGAALLATTLTDATIAQSVGIFVFVGALTLIVGISGWFEKLTRQIPLALASAMLAGILVQFGINIFTSLQASPLLVTAMLATYLICKRVVPRYAIVMVLFCGVSVALFSDNLAADNIELSFALPVWVTPVFDLALLLGVGLPLFIVTMTSQNVPGVAVLKASGFGQQPISPIITTTGGLNLLLAPLGGFAFNLAAITAAICTSEEAHPDPDKRYVAGIFTGIFNIIAGLFAVTVVSLFSIFPQAMIAALAGLALLSTIGMSLNTAVNDVHHRDAAIITFLVTASGISLFGIASAFWGIVIGLVASQFSKKAG